MYFIKCIVIKVKILFDLKICYLCEVNNNWVMKVIIFCRLFFFILYKSKLLLVFLNSVIMCINVYFCF